MDDYGLQRSSADVEWLLWLLWSLSGVVAPCMAKNHSKKPVPLNMEIVSFASDGENLTVTTKIMVGEEEPVYRAEIFSVPQCDDDVWDPLDDALADLLEELGNAVMDRIEDFLEKNRDFLIYRSCGAS